MTSQTLLSSDQIDRLDKLDGQWKWALVRDDNGVALEMFDDPASAQLRWMELSDRWPGMYSVRTITYQVADKETAEAIDLFWFEMVHWENPAKAMREHRERAARYPISGEKLMP